MISEVLGREYKLSDKMLAEADRVKQEKQELRDKVKAGRDRQQEIIRELAQAREDDHVPNIRRLTKEQTELEETIAENQWYLKREGTDTQPIIDQFESEVRPDFDAAISEAEARAQEAAQPYFDALADLTRLQRKKHAIAHSWNNIIKDSSNVEAVRRQTIPNSERLPAGLVVNYQIRASHAKGYAKNYHDLLEQEDYWAIQREKDNEYQRQWLAERDEDKRKYDLMQLARKHEGRTLQEALRAERRDKEVINPPPGVTILAFDQKRFEANLEEGRRLLEEQEAE